MNDVVRDMWSSAWAGGLPGHTGPGNNYAAGPVHGANAPITIACYVTGQSITNSHYNDTTTIWDLAVGGYYYSDAWLYTGGGALLGLWLRS